MSYKLFSLIFLISLLLCSYSILYEKKIKPKTGNEEEAFAYSLDMDGERAIVGAPITSPYQNEGGSVYIYEREGTWKELTRIKKWNDEAYRSFGTDVAISGDYAVIGAPTSQLQRGVTSGAAYIFHHKNGSWVEQARLNGELMRQGVDFGQAVDIDDNTVIIGVHDHDRDYGAAYIFVRQGSSWEQQAKIKGEGVNRGDGFGFSVSIEGNFAAIGAPDADNGGGHVYIFHREGENWVQRVRLNTEAKSEIPAVAQIRNTVSESRDAVASQDISSALSSEIINSVGDNFGYSIDMNDGQIIVGAPGHDYENGGDYDEGTAYIFDVASGTPIHKLRNKEGRLGNIITPQFSFGTSVAISGDHTLVGAIGSGGVRGMTGGAYAFTDGRQTHFHLPEDADGDIGFGQAVALSDILCPWIGAPGEGWNVQKIGAVYYYCD